MIDETPRTGAGNPVSATIVPVTQPAITRDEIDEFMMYAIRCERVYQATRRRCGGNIFGGGIDESYRLLWQKSCELVTKHGGDKLPPMLKEMLKTEIAREAANGLSPGTEMALLGSPTDLGGSGPRVGGLLDRIFAVPQEELDSNESRGMELLNRLAYEYQVAELFRQYVNNCSGELPTPESLREVCHSVAAGLESLTVDTDGFGLITSSEFAAMDCQHHWLVKGLLVADEPVVIGGPRKALKTSIAVNLAVSLSLGPPARFLGHFDIPEKVPVGLYSGESGPNTLQETAQRICKAKGCELSDCDLYWGFRLPRLSVRQNLDAMAADIRSRQLRVVIIDPLYMCMLAGNTRASASNLFDVGPLLAEVATVCREQGAMPIFVHHMVKASSKSNFTPKLEDLAFAGIQEFARQWVLIGRRTDYEHGGLHCLSLNIGGSAGFSGSYEVEIDEGNLQEDFSGRRWNVAVKRLDDTATPKESEDWHKISNSPRS